MRERKLYPCKVKPGVKSINAMNIGKNYDIEWNTINRCARQKRKCAHWKSHFIEASVQISVCECWKLRNSMDIKSLDGRQSKCRIFTTTIEVVNLHRIILNTLLYRK